MIPLRDMPFYNLRIKIIEDNIRHCHKYNLYRLQTRYRDPYTTLRLCLHDTFAVLHMCYTNATKGEISEYRQLSLPLSPPGPSPLSLGRRSCWRRHSPN